MKKLVLLIGVLFSSVAFAADNPISCSGVGCKVKVRTTDDGILAVDGATGSSSATLELRSQNAGNFVLCAAGTSNDCMTGLTPGDVLIKTGAEPLYFSADNGTSIQGSLTAAGAWTLGAPGGSEFLTVNGEIKQVGSNRVTIGSGIGSEGFRNTGISTASAQVSTTIVAFYPFSDDDDIAIRGHCILSGVDSANPLYGVYDLYYANRVDTSAGTCTLDTAVNVVTAVAETAGAADPTVTVSTVDTATDGTSGNPCQYNIQINNNNFSGAGAPNAASRLNCMFYKASRRGVAGW